MVFRIEPSISVLVCSKGGGGLLNERMELVADLWKANIKVGSNFEKYHRQGSERRVKLLWLWPLLIDLLFSGSVCSSGRPKSARTVWICQWSWHQMPRIYHGIRSLTDRSREGKYIKSWTVRDCTLLLSNCFGFYLLLCCVFVLWLWVWTFKSISYMPICQL